MRFISTLEDISSENFFHAQIVNIMLYRSCVLYGVDMGNLLYLFSLDEDKEDINQFLFSCLNGNLYATSCLKLI